MNSVFHCKFASEITKNYRLMQEKTVKKAKVITKEDVAFLYASLSKREKGILLRGLERKFGGKAFTWMRRFGFWCGGRPYPEMKEQIRNMAWRYIMSEKWRQDGVVK